MLQAIRDNEQRARCLGYDTRRYKLLAFVLSSAFMGLAGSLLTFLIQPQAHRELPGSRTAGEACNASKVFVVEIHIRIAPVG